MSFALTTRQMYLGTKTVTRRQGWKSLKMGDQLMAVEKSQGLKKGERVQRIGVIKILCVTQERIDSITPEDVVAEGFPEMSPEEFISMYCAANKVKPSDYCTRIGFFPFPSFSIKSAAGNDFRVCCFEETDSASLLNLDYGALLHFLEEYAAVTRFSTAAQKRFQRWAEWLPSNSCFAPDHAHQARHIPTGEDWHILGIDWVNGKACAAGWPPSIGSLKHFTGWENLGPLPQNEKEYRLEKFGSSFI